MTKRTYKLFIFDFDGTLGDTSECVVTSFQDALKKNNLSVADRQEIIQHMGISLPEVFKKLTQHQYGEEMYDTLVNDYRTFYRVYLTQKTKIFPHVKDTLAYIKTKGGKISIATSKKTEFAKLSCEFLGIDQYIDLYIGDDKVHNKKPHPEMLEHTVKELFIDPTNAVMVGDATTDIEMGKRFGITTIAVTWGAHTREALEAARPDFIVDSAVQLEDLCGRLHLNGVK